MIPATFIRRLLSKSKHSASNAFYNHGKRCATHQVLVMLLCLVAIVTLSYPLLLDYAIGLDYPYVPSIDNHDQSLFWEHPYTRVPVADQDKEINCIDVPVMRVERLILDGDHETLSKKFFLGVLDRKILFHTLRLQQLIEKTRLSLTHGLSFENLRYFSFSSSKPTSSLADICFVPEHLRNNKDSKCLMQSPLDFWDNNFENLLSDPHLTHTLSNTTHMSSKFHFIIPPSSVLKNIVRDRRTHRIRSASGLVLTFFLWEQHACETVSNDHDIWDLIMKDISSSSRISADSPDRWPSFKIDRQHGHTNNILFQFDDNAKSRSSSRAEFLLLAFGYLAVFLYISFSIGRMELVKSKFGLGFAALTQVFISLILSLSLCSFFNIRMTLVPGEILPFLLIVIGVENMTLLTKAVVKTNVGLPVRERIAQGLSNVGLPITLSVLGDLGLLLMVGVLGVTAVREFCNFAALALILDYALQMTYFITILSIDLRRLELADLNHRGSQSSTTRNSKRTFKTERFQRIWPTSFRISSLAVLSKSKFIHALSNPLSAIARRPRASSFFIMIIIVASLSLFYSAPSTFIPSPSSNIAHATSLSASPRSPNSVMLVAETERDSERHVAPSPTATLYHAAPMMSNSSTRNKHAQSLRSIFHLEKMGHNVEGGGALMATAIRHVGKWWHTVLHGSDSLSERALFHEHMIVNAAESFWKVVNPNREPIFMSIRPPWHVRFVYDIKDEKSESKGMNDPSATTTLRDRKLTEEASDEEIEDDHGSSLDFERLLKFLLGPMLTLAGAMLWLISSLLGGTLSSAGSDEQDGVELKSFDIPLVAFEMPMYHERDVELIAASPTGVIATVGLDKSVVLWELNGITTAPIMELYKDTNPHWPITRMVLDQRATWIAACIGQSTIILWDLYALPNDGNCERLIHFDKTDKILSIGFIFESILPSQGGGMPGSVSGSGSMVAGPPASPIMPSKASSEVDTNTTLLVVTAQGKLYEINARTGKITKVVSLFDEDSIRVTRVYLESLFETPYDPYRVFTFDNRFRLCCWRKKDSDNCWNCCFMVGFSERKLTAVAVRCLASLGGNSISESLPLLVICGFDDGSHAVIDGCIGDLLLNVPNIGLGFPIRHIRTVNTVVEQRQDLQSCLCKGRVNVQIVSSSDNAKDKLRCIKIELRDTAMDINSDYCPLHTHHSPKKIPKDDGCQNGSFIPLALHGMHQRRQNQQDRRGSSQAVVYSNGGAGGEDMGQHISGYTAELVNDNIVHVEAGNGWGVIDNFVVGLSRKAQKESTTFPHDWQGWLIDLNNSSLKVQTFEVDNQDSPRSSLDPLPNQNEPSGDAGTDSLKSISLSRRRSRTTTIESNSIFKITTARSDSSASSKTRLKAVGPGEIDTTMSIPVYKIRRCVNSDGDTLVFAFGNRLKVIRSKSISMMATRSKLGSIGSPFLFSPRGNRMHGRPRTPSISEQLEKLSPTPIITRHMNGNKKTV